MAVPGPPTHAAPQAPLSASLASSPDAIEAVSRPTVSPDAGTPQAVLEIAQTTDMDEKAISREATLDGDLKEDDAKDLERGEVKGSLGDAGSGGDTPAVVLETHHANGLQDQTSYLPAKQVIIIFGGLTMSIFLSFLDQTIVSTALPSISAAFDSGRSASWVASAYLLTSTAVQPLWGRLSDVFGRKMCLMACVVIFAIGSLACALSTSMTMLIWFRGVKGCGGGGLLTLVLIIVSDIVSLKERGKYQGINEMTIAVANGIGPILGGVLSERVGWRWCFWINLPFSGLTLAVIAICLPLKAIHGDLRKKLKQVDYGGALITVFGAALIILPLNWGGTSFPWISGPVLGCLIAGVALLAFLFVYEAKFAIIPIVPPSIFRRRTCNAIFLSTLFSGASILMQSFYIPQFFQVVRGDSPIRSGVLMVPLLMLNTFSVFCGGQLILHTGEYKINICLGYAVWCIGLGLFSTIDQSTSTARIVGYMVVSGLGQGQTLQTSMVALQAAVSRAEMSTVTATRNFLRSLGGSLSLAVCAAIINNTLRSQLSTLNFSSDLISSIVDDSTAIWRPTIRGNTVLYDLPANDKAEIIAAFVTGFHRVFYVFVGLMGIDCIIAVLFVERISLRRDDEQALKERGKAWVQERGDKKKRKAGGAVEEDLELGDKASEKTLGGEPDPKT